jgi:ADP-heptose:LPS heptosyltransferase
MKTNIRILRNMDYWVGIPLCFLFSFIDRFLKLFRHKIQSTKRYSETIVFIKLSEMGSTVLSFSAIYRAKELYPDANIYFWIFKSSREAIDILNIVPKENVIEMDDDSIFCLVLSAIKNILYVRSLNVKMVIDLELFSRVTALLTFFSGAVIKIGFDRCLQEGLYRGNFLTHKVQFNPHLHISKNFLALVEALTANYDIPFLKSSLKAYADVRPEVTAGSEKKQQMFDLLSSQVNNIDKCKKIVVIPSPFDDLIPIRQWPVEYYEGLVKNLLLDPDILIIVIGKTNMMTKNAVKTFDIDKERLIDLSGRTSIEDIIAIFEISSILVSHDCGLIHFAALTSIPIIAIFGPETPTCYGPLSLNKTIFFSDYHCSPCLSVYNNRLSPCKNNKCLQSISVGAVYNKCVDLLRDRQDVL